MSQKEEPKRQRRAYSKPELRRVRLSPEESLAVGCKVVSQAAPGPGPDCDSQSCWDLGS
jgi:hypothetical protein